MRQISRCSSTEIDVRALLMSSRSGFQSSRTADRQLNLRPASPATLKLVIELASIACDAMANFLRRPSPDCQKRQVSNWPPYSARFQTEYPGDFDEEARRSRSFDDIDPETLELSHAQGLGRRIAHRNYSRRIDIRHRENHQLLTLGRQGDGRPNVFLTCFGIFHGSRPESTSRVSNLMPSFRSIRRT